MADNFLNTANFDQARNALELNGLNNIRQQSKATDGETKKAALQEAAQQFEAIFTQMLLKSMRKAQEVLESDSPFNSQSTKFYRDMHDQQMSLEMSSNGSLGLTDLIVRQLGGDSDSFTPRTVLRNDANLEQIKRLAKEDKLSAQHAQTADDYLAKQLNRASSAMRDETTIPYEPQAKPIVTAETSVGTNKNVNFSTPSFDAPKDFVTALTEPAKAVQEKLGVPFQVVIAQAALETGWGQKIIKHENGTSSNNLFNIKADNRWAGEKIQKETLEFEQGAMVKKSAPFRAYQNLSESFNDYVNFLSDSDRYQDALQNSGDVEHFLHGLQKAGYATDPQYANKIMATLRTVSNLITK
ncbi:MAG: flagellar assembly peptidoglycan hydrolase FlgJ [Colwellia sp.]|nr:flagellar assembly peptidoglycan hydrolase FlgJ [Colwellia sp.]MCW9081149.1 flagellar assembly peptidoglycan hydrolase FlgJ [Colwellia sp.]